jgi:hypothetical protein
MARRLVLDQHVHLRKLLMMGLAHARAALGDGATSHEPLHALVAEIRGVFLRHLADEEALLFPILEDNLPLGPRLADLIREEHTRQRGELEALCGWPDDGCGRELVVRFSKLAVALIEDIAHEEREVLIPEVVRDDQVVVDQSGG